MNRANKTITEVNKNAIDLLGGVSGTWTVVGQKGRRDRSSK